MHPTATKKLLTLRNTKKRMVIGFWWQWLCGSNRTKALARCWNLARSKNSKNIDEDVIVAISAANDLMHGTNFQRIPPILNSEIGEIGTGTWENTNNFMIFVISVPNYPRVPIFIKIRRLFIFFDFYWFFSDFFPTSLRFTQNAERLQGQIRARFEAWRLPLNIQ